MPSLPESDMKSYLDTLTESVVTKINASLHRLSGIHYKYLTYEVSYEEQKIILFAKDKDREYCFDQNYDLIYDDILTASYKGEFNKKTFHDWFVQDCWMKSQAIFGYSEYYLFEKGSSDDQNEYLNNHLNLKGADFDDVIALAQEHLRLATNATIQAINDSIKNLTENTTCLDFEMFPDDFTIMLYPMDKEYCQIEAFDIGKSLLCMSASDFWASEDNAEDTTEIDQLDDQLFEKKKEIFKEWFIEKCWKKSNGINCKRPSFYRSHDAPDEKIELPLTQG